MEGSVLSFHKAEWKVSNTGSAHWAFSYMYLQGLYLMFLSLVFFYECSWNTVHLTWNINQSIKNHITCRFYLCHLSCSLMALPIIWCYTWGRRGRDRMVVGFTTTYAISSYHHWWCEFESQSWRGVQHYVIKFVSDLWQLGCFLQVLWFPPPTKLMPQYNWNIVESGVNIIYIYIYIS